MMSQYALVLFAVFLQLYLKSCCSSRTGMHNINKQTQQRIKTYSRRRCKEILRIPRGGGRGDYGDSYGGEYYEPDPYYSRKDPYEPYPEDDDWDDWDEPRGPPGQQTLRKRRPPPKEMRQKGPGRIGGVNWTSILMQGNKKWGITCLAVAVMLTGLGISLFFNPFLIRVGNMALVVGVSLLIGPGRCIKYFSHPSKLRGTIIFIIGFLLVFSGHPILGIICEIFGFLNLFGNMLPIFVVMAKNLPLLGDFLPDSGGSRPLKKQPRKRPLPKQNMPRDDIFPEDEGYQPYDRPDYRNY